MTAPASLRVEQADGVTTLTLDRPDRLNALSYALVRELGAALTTLRTDHRQRVVVLRGAGRAFCSGIDLKELASGARWEPDRGPLQARYALQEAVADLISGLRRLPQPVIAVVHGAAAGGGLSLACAADVRIAEPPASFTPSFVRIGASGGDMGSSYFLPRIVGAERAAEILYTGRTVEAKEAARIGLVSRVVADGTGADAADELARRITAVAPMSTRMTKSLLRLSQDGASLEQMLELENRTQILTTQTDDFVEGARAFAERRPARYTDR